MEFEFTNLGGATSVLTRKKNSLDKNLLGEYSLDQNNFISKNNKDYI